mgnify:CR=1 FL=1
MPARQRPAPPDTLTHVPRTLPRGLHRLPHEVVLLSQQARLVEGTALAVAERGYAATTVADIIARAGVSRTTFYQLYKDKEDCFLSCFEPLAQSHLALVESAIAAPGPHAERLVRGLRAYLERVDADRGFACAFIGEAESASPAIRAAYQRARGRVGATLRRWLDAARRDHPDIPPCSPLTLELVNHALGAFIVDGVRADRPLLPQTAELAAFLFSAFGMPRWAAHVRDTARA